MSTRRQNQHFKVTEYIRQRIDISQDEIEEYLQYAEYKTFAKGEYILRSGEYCRFIGFLNKGFIVTTVVDDSGLEKAAEFKQEGCFFTYTEGLALNQPSHKNFIAIEESEALILDKGDLKKIFELQPKFEALFSQILAEELKLVLTNDQMNKSLRIEERYLALENSFPGVFQKIPIKYIAGYLGIAAPSLSRLRKRLARKKN